MIFPFAKLIVLLIIVFFCLSIPISKLVSTDMIFPTTLNLFCFDSQMNDLFFSDNIKRLVQNYRIGYLRLMQYQLARNNTEEVKILVKQLNDYFPNDVLPMDPWLGFELIDKIYKPIEDIENIEDQIGKGAIIDMKFSYWYISQIYASHNKMDKAKIYQQKSIDIIDEIAKQITSSNDKNSFINAEYYHNKIKQDISTIEEIKKEADTPSIFAFCPSCGFKNENLFAFCPSCGNDLKQ